MSKYVSYALLVVILVAPALPMESAGREIALHPDSVELAAGINRFAVELYHALVNESAENLCFSPYSLALALAMTCAGARGETAAQMAGVLHFTLPQERLHPAFRMVNSFLVSSAREPGFLLRVANALWGQEDHPFLPEFLTLLKENYGAELKQVNFAKDPEGARRTINAWVARQTEGRILELLPPGTVHSLTLLILTNALYFRALWRSPFIPEFTMERPFYLLDGSSIEVLMMHTLSFLNYVEGPDYQAVELPYRDGSEGSPAFSMVILLPKPGHFLAFERMLTAERLEEITRSLATTRVALALPKFQLRTRRQLGSVLAKLGMASPFGPKADFSGMDGGHGLWLGEVVHEALVIVDEEGTEAAAATAAILLTAAFIEEEPVEMEVNRPFIFLIREQTTGLILFLGRVVDPRA